MLDGELTFRLGDRLVPAPAGTFLWGPRDVPHQYRVDFPNRWLLTLFVPGGGEEIFFHMSRPAEALTLPPPSDQPAIPPSDLIAMLERRYGEKVLGPPMGPPE